ncbi:MAG: peptidase [Gemmatimonadetes bacterium]|nr:peptidase [Gemmatimonadota bacterium]|tara:strand:- start:121779 stop:124358 length:2580 start_codon:yes stop_codon:yes gene_type:complete
MFCKELKMMAMTMSLVLLQIFGASSVLVASEAQGERNTGNLPSIDEMTEGMQKMDGFLPLYWDEDMGELWMEVPELNQEMIHYVGYGAGLGSNDLGLDRGALRGSRMVKFEKVGRKILMVQPNYQFRAITDNLSEVRAVRDAFARSVLWSFAAEAQTGDRVLVNATQFLLRDAINAAQRMQPGTYRLDTDRSSIYMEMTNSFPTNTEMEAELTFVQQPGSGGGGRGGFGGGNSNFEGVGSVAATGEAASIRMHHSFVQVPDDNYVPRAFNSQAGYGAVTYQDYAVPLGEPMTQRFIRRHRLEKKNPSARMSEAIEPIVYYLDPGTPEPIRSALLDGARWWNQAFEAAGYIDAFQVAMRPDSISPLDARYNVINWVHRSTRGWSTGGSVTDPRTGEIIKGVVTLGSLRIRQDYMIAEGLLSPYENGDETPPELAEWSLARIRQLSAHEVGHTIGLGHNYYNSGAGRISVMDYPHHLVNLNSDGSLDYSEVYDVDIGEWDKVAVNYGYREFPAGTNETEELNRMLEVARGDDILYMSNQDIATTPQADQWANGNDVGVELNRMMDVRAAAMRRFGEKAIQSGAPMATIEETLVPLYLHHRFQVESTASAVGGVEYTYAVRGDGLQPFQRVSAQAQNAAIDALMRTLELSELKIPDHILSLIPPRPPGYGSHREMFPRYTGSAFDAVTPAVVAASHTVNFLLEQSRAARLVEQKALDPNLPGLRDVLSRLFDATLGAETDSPYDLSVKRAVVGVVVDRVKWLAVNSPMMEVRGIASSTLEMVSEVLGSSEQQEGSLAGFLVRDIKRFLNRSAENFREINQVSPPPGAPIGQPAMDWIQRSELWYTWLEQDWLRGQPFGGHWH